MNFYNMNKSVGLAQNIDIDKERYNDTNIFILSEDNESLKNNFLSPNIKRRLGSYIIFDHNNEIYNVCKNTFNESGYEIEKYNLDESYNLFSFIEGESEITVFSNTILHNSKYVRSILNSKYKNNKELYDKLELILRLILIYIFEKAPLEKRNFIFLKKIILKLKQNNLEYYRKIFTNISVTLNTNTYIYKVEYLKEEEYTEIISILVKVANELPNDIINTNNLFDKLEILYNGNKLKVIFIELTKEQLINSMFCYKAENYLHSQKECKIPVFYMYVALEKIGYIDNLSEMVRRYSQNNNIIRIIHFYDVAKVIRLYKKSLTDVMENIVYGLIFQTKNANNIKYLPKLLLNNTLADMMNQILVNPSYCIIYRAKNRTTIEHILLDEKNPNKINQSSTHSINSDFSEKVNNQMDSLETEDDLLEQLKIDIENENDPIKRKHFTNMYNFFS